MADSDKLIPFILYFEAGLRKSDLMLPLPQMFEKARATGFANDPYDSGGATLCGVTIGTYRLYRKLYGKTQNGKPTTASDLKKMPFSEWKEIFKSQYWNRWDGDSIKNQSLANILVDWVWASGNYGIKIPQRILGVKDDGIVGMKTLTALNAAEPQSLFSKIRKARIDFIEDIVRRKPTQARFLKGWKRRIDCITYNGLIYG